MTNITQFEAAFIKEQYRIRKTLADHNVSNFYFSASADGRTMTGDIKIEFKLGKQSYSEIVKGNSVDAVLDEFLRREGFEKKHDSLCLPSVAPQELNGEQKITLNLANTKEESSYDDDLPV